MKPLLYVLVAALIVTHALGDGVKEITSFFSEDEILALEATVEPSTSGGSPHEPDNYFGEVRLPSDLIKRLHENVLGGSCPEDLPGDGAKIRIKQMAKTTDSHRDTFVMRPDRQIVEDDVAFVVLNTNKDAKFIHGTEEVPMRAGSLITFPGSTCHHTVVNSGHAKIVGPFHVSSMERVGDTCQGDGERCCPKGDGKCCKGQTCEGAPEDCDFDPSGKGGIGTCMPKSTKSSKSRRALKDDPTQEDYAIEDSTKLAKNVRAG